jgi:hypothetical protein
MKRCQAVLVSRALRPGIQQQFNELHMASTGSPEQGRPPQPVRHVDRAPLLQQPLDRAEITDGHSHKKDVLLTHRPEGRRCIQLVNLKREQQRRATQAVPYADKLGNAPHQLYRLLRVAHENRVPKKLRERATGEEQQSNRAQHG